MATLFRHATYHRGLIETMGGHGGEANHVPAPTLMILCQWAIITKSVTRKAVAWLFSKHCLWLGSMSKPAWVSKPALLAESVQVPIPQNRPRLFSTGSSVRGVGAHDHPLACWSDVGFDGPGHWPILASHGVVRWSEMQQPNRWPMAPLPIWAFSHCSCSCVSTGKCGVPNSITGFRSLATIETLALWAGLVGGAQWVLTIVHLR